MLRLLMIFILLLPCTVSYAQEDASLAREIHLLREEVRLLREEIRALKHGQDAHEVNASAQDEEGGTAPVGAALLSRPEYDGEDGEDDEEHRQLQERFSQWKAEFIEDAVTQGIDRAIAEDVMKVSHYIPRIIELDRAQPEGTLTFEEYKERVLPPSRIERGRKMLKENRAAIKAAADKYGVQPRFIVALWGVETDFGRNTGGFFIPEALATLAFDGRRSDFFRDELIHALRIIQEGHIEAADMHGSWAGAMGQSQFMPSSFISYAADGNGDGRKDIWSTKEDVFASIANYLSSVGWDDKYTWGRRVQLADAVQPDEALLGVKVKHKLSHWHELGVRKQGGAPLPNVDIEASLIRPDEGGEYYLYYENAQTLMRWNRSYYFVTSVGLLSDALIELDK